MIIKPLDMETPAIKVHEIGKCYKIYANSNDRLKQIIWGERRKYYDEFWAIRDVSFELYKGHALGIIGNNGSGKSTLLQMVCGTLRPSEGNIKINGRIAALLELGSGFNPDFTGIENIFLNASLLGLSKKETESKLDDILAFADIGAFAKQPVKIYSSGMAVRLAFSVVAHVDADILIVDEALAVGDAYFTQKCMRFIQRHREENCLLFVSHDANAVMSLCDKAILLGEGKLQRIGKPKEIITEYMKRLQNQDSTKAESLLQKTNTIIQTPPELQSKVIETQREIALNDTDKWRDYRNTLINDSNLKNWLIISKFDKNLQVSESFGTGKAEILDVRLVEGSSNIPLNVAVGGEIVTLQIKAKANGEIKNLIAGFILKNDKGLTLLGDNSLNSFPDATINYLTTGEKVLAVFNFTMPLLPAGSYSLTASIAEGTQAEHTILHWLNDALIFRSECNSIAAGLAGVAMHHISITLDTEL